MTTVLLLIAIGAPLLLAALTLSDGRVGRGARRIAPVAAVPVLLLAVLPVDYPAAVLPWLLLGTSFELDVIGRIFLLVAAGLWSAAGAFARAYLPVREHRRFYLFFLLTMTGNLGLPIAGDAVTFYLFFALMTFAGYGLVIHFGDAEAKRAGRIYLALAVLGEAFLLSGLMMAVHAAQDIGLASVARGIGGSPLAGWIIGCLLIGFGIKAGAVPLHVWLPLAHPVAPTPASAVLSGSMIKAGLLGWIRLLPLGHFALPDWGTLVIALGVLAAFFGVAVGVVQSNPKTVLAYSSISQMGLMNVGIGIALAAPEAAIPAIAAVVWYAAHHGLAKGALFLGVGVAGRVPGNRGGRAAVTAGLILCALAIAGAPLTSGSVAKANLKQLVGFSPAVWAGWLEWLLPISAAATTLLMARFLHLLLPKMSQEADSPAGGWMLIPWAALLAAVAIALRLLPRWYPLGDPADRGLYYLVIDILPIAGGGLLFWLLVLRFWRPAPDAAPLLIPGDVLNPVGRLLMPVAMLVWRSLHLRDREWGTKIASLWYRVYAESDRHDLVLRLELGLTRWASAIFLLLVVSGILLWLIV